MPLKFVYGSLMLHNKALRSGKAAYINDHEICFNHIGISKWEPSFANIEKSEGNRAWGVLVDFQHEIWTEIKKDEFSYIEINVIAIAMDEKRYRCTTLTLMEKFKDLEKPPSARYAKMLWEGAKYHRIPDAVLKKYEGYYRKGHKGTLWLGPVRFPIFWIARLLIRLMVKSGKLG